MEDDVSGEYCELLDKNLPLDHEFFLYDSQIKILINYNYILA